MENTNYNIPKEKFQFANSGRIIHDKELATKPVGYLKDAFYRFRKNKASIFASCIILVIVLFAIIVPLVSPYHVSDEDPYYRFSLPKLTASENYKLDFWDGCKNRAVNESDFLKYYAMGLENGNSPIKNNEFVIDEDVDYTFNLVKQMAKYNPSVTYYQRIATGDKKNPFDYLPIEGLTSENFDPKKNTYYTRAEEKIRKYEIRYDSYAATGTIFKSLTMDEYFNIQKYQDETGIQVIYPITDKKLRPAGNTANNLDANYWFTTTKNGSQDIPVYHIDENGNYAFDNIYVKVLDTPNASGKIATDDYFSRMRIEGENTYLYQYAILNETGYNCRLNYHAYYVYQHTYVIKDRIKEPCYLFGADPFGKDMFSCLANGARFSLIFAVVVSVVNLIVGAIYGAIEGYYGGTADIIMERIVEILSAVPFMIVISLLNYYMEKSSQVLILFIAFFATGWIGMSGSTRMQFYRFKNQEYVLAARTLGAKDRRIMFKHIFPNSLGTLITGSVLTIPGMIFSETSLSYLGIINLSTGNITSVGTLLANGQPYLQSYPHIIASPAIFISLLMLSFNLFGNGLRDAFNPSLRGSED